MEVPQDGWFIWENPFLKRMIWGYPPIHGNPQITRTSTRLFYGELPKVDHGIKLYNIINDKRL